MMLHSHMKTKSSFSLPPDPNSLKQALLRVHHQVYYWIRFNHRIVTELDPTKYGWNVDRDLVTPVWYEGTQLPASMTTQKQKGTILLMSLKSSKHVWKSRVRKCQQMIQIRYHVICKTNQITYTLANRLLKTTLVTLITIITFEFSSQINKVDLIQIIRRCSKEASHRYCVFRFHYAVMFLYILYG